MTKDFELRDGSLMVRHVRVNDPQFSVATKDHMIWMTRKEAELIQDMLWKLLSIVDED